MTTALRHPAAPRPRAATVLAILALAAAVIAGAWLLGDATAPTPGDAADERATASERAYDDARAASYTPAYEAAWESAFATGAEAGRTEGEAAGVATARSELA